MAKKIAQSLLFNRMQRLEQYTRTINSQSVKVYETDVNDKVTRCSGTVTITNGGAGYATGCLYLKTDGGIATTLYVNEGTSSSCDFNAMETAASTITGIVASSGLTGDATEGTATLAVGAGRGVAVRANAVDVGVDVYNQTGGTLAVGTLVNLSGFDTTLGVTMTKADADAGIRATHVVLDAINNVTAGVVYPVGTAVGVATNGRTIGDLVYVDATTAGAFAFSAPTGSDQIAQVVGIVKVVDAAVGEIVFFPGIAQITKIGRSMLQNEAINSDKLDNNIFVTNGGLIKNGPDLRIGLTIYNQTGGTLNAGTLLQISSFTGTDGVVVTKADADAGIRATHVVLAAINNLTSGYVYQVGVATGVDTNGRTIGDAVYLDATTAGGFTFTAPTGADQMVQLVGVVKVVNVSGEIVFFPGSAHITKMPTSMLQDGAVTPIKNRASEALTATGDGLTTGQMSGSTTHAVVTSGAATDWITLPASSAGLLGKQFTIWVGANGFELVTPGTSGATINGTDSDGTNQADIPANSLSRLTLVATDTWLLENIAANGTVAAAITPDND